MTVPDPCPGCGAEAGSGEDWKRAFVPYEAAPNDAQAELGWVDDIPERLFAFVCSECGAVLGVVTDGLPEGEPPSRSDQFRADEELR